MKYLLLVLVVCTITFAHAQDNTMPTTGNVGIGTLNPSSRLDVNGTMKVDSSIIVKDTAIFQADARVEHDLKVEGQLFIPNINDGTPADPNNKFMISTTDGQTKSLDKSGLLQALYGSNCFTPVDINGIPSGSTPI